MKNITELMKITKSDLLIALSMTIFSILFYLFYTQLYIEKQVTDKTLQPTNIEKYMVVNLDNQGLLIRHLKQKEGVYFDWDGDSFVTASDWIGSGSAFLIHYKGKTPVENLNGTNLFENPSKNSDRSILNYDSDGDKQIDSKEDVWNELYLWEDKNSDGIVQNNEVASLDQALAAAISLKHNYIRLRNNSRLPIKYFTPIIEKQNTRYSANVDIQFESLFLPNIRGFSKIPDLRVAISLNKNIMAPLQALCTLDPTEVFSNKADKLVEHVMYIWGNVENEDPKSRGLNIDSRKIYFMENYFFEKYYQKDTRNPNPGRSAAAGLENIWHGLLESSKHKIIGQCQAKKLLDEKIYYDFSQDKLVVNNNKISDKTLQNFVDFEPKESKPIYWRNAKSFLIYVYGEAALTHIDTRIQEIAKSQISKIVHSDEVTDRTNDTKAYDTYNDIPLMLRSGIRARANFDSYIKNIEFRFAKASGGNDVINADILKERGDETIKETIKQQRLSTLKYDDDFDSKVTLEEVTAYFDKKNINYNEEQKKARMERSITHAMALDKDDDKIITSEEMLVLDAKKEQQLKDYLSKSYKIYFELDSNKDGTLMLSELKALAEKTFATVDMDKDSMISNEEYTAFRDGQRTIIDLGTRNKTNTNSTEAEKITKTASFIKGIDAATTTFRDVYNAFPGDLVNAEKRIPNCKLDTCGSGNGDSVVGTSELKKIELHKDERHLFWGHLRKVDLLAGYDADSKEAAWGKAFPASPLGGGFHVYSYNGSGALPKTFERTSARSGLYLILTNDIQGDFSSPDSHFLTAAQASRLDRKLDDGLPLTGSVISAGDKKCLEEKNGILNYKQTEESESQEKCLSLYIRIQSYGGSRKASPIMNVRSQQRQSAAMLTQYPAGIRTSLVRMIIGGTKVDDLYFDATASIGEQENLKQYVFSPSGGGATYRNISAENMANGKEGVWIYSSGWRIDKIGTTENELIALLPYVNLDLCKAVNTELSISSNDKDGDGIPKGSAKDILPEFSHNMIKNYPGISKEIDAIGELPFLGKPFGCYDLSDSNNKAGDGPYVYYHVLIER